MTRVAVSPLTGTVYAGRMNKAGNAWGGAKTDVTSDFLRAVLEKAEFHGGKFEIRGSAGTLHTVTVIATQAGEGGSPIRAEGSCTCASASGPDYCEVHAS